MKTTLTIISTILTGVLSFLSAQSSPLYIKLYTTDSTSSAFGPATTAMFFSFSDVGKDSIDMFDLGNLSNITTGRDYCSPFSTSAENEILTLYDNRSFFTAPRTVPLGIYSWYASTISLSSVSLGSVPDYNDTAWNEEVGNIYVEDLASGVMHDIFGDTAALSVPANSTPTVGFQLHFFPALRVAATNETCIESADGSLHITNPGSTNWTLLISGPSGISSMPVMHTDTVLNMLQPGTYTLTAFTDGMLSDNQTASIGAGSFVIPSFTPSATVQGQGLNINFTNNTPNNCSWNWDMGDGNIYTSQNVSHSFSTAGIYYVLLTATDTAGCAGSTNHTIQITYVPPSNSTTLSSPDQMVTQYEAETKYPRVATREANTLVITQQSETTIAQINVYTMAGSLVATQNTTSAVTEIQLPQSGCYIVFMTLSNGEIKSERFVVAQ